jgi:hypothetical protein
MDWRGALVILLALCLLYPMYLYRFPNLTNREAAWVICGMIAGQICWVVAVGMGYRLHTMGAHTIAASTLIGGIFGWLAAKVFRTERN